MMLGQIGLSRRMTHSNRQLLQSQVCNRSVDPLFERQRERELLDSDFDGEFPNRSSDEEQIIGQISQGLCRSGAQPRWVVHRPNQRMSIQQEPHSMYSLKSSNGASKSG